MIPPNLRLVAFINSLLSSPTFCLYLLVPSEKRTSRISALKFFFPFLFKSLKALYLLLACHVAVLFSVSGAPTPFLIANKSHTRETRVNSGASILFFSRHANNCVANARMGFKIPTFCFQQQ